MTSRRQPSVDQTVSSRSSWSSVSAAPSRSLASAGLVPLLVTGDAQLAAEVHRLAAAAGTPLDLVTEATDARSRWPDAPVVLVGADAVAALAGGAPARRGRVHVVALQPLPDAIFRAALAIGAESVLELPAAETWLVETLGDTADGSTSLATVVAVVGGCGGAGATTFATALALAAASDVHPVTLVDADPLGSGIERVAGLDDVAGAGWASMLESAGRLGSRSLRAALPRRSGLAVLGWGAGTRAELDPYVVREVVSAARRGSALVVLDVPRYADPAVTELLLGADHLVVVCPLSLAAVAATARLVGSVLPLVRQAHLVARGPSSALDPDEVGAALGLRLAAVMPDQRRVAEWVELGLGPIHARRGPLARAARSTLAQLATPRMFCAEAVA